ncbi:hypothetical protein CGCF415_v002680 [Colletotrichum fructicola]|uniref:Uncharacterized protein n=1 Tax=Colletotrichum fructicola (strain Nara gc5) TaxID=1213859 RepID=L2FS02_COLFN|nr:uncharacterized protein CGMCC3_g10321 [Colletotrichum fructicola]KAF4484406.1 hypothetical protein CGGC5_v006820 [Colletotrichum fructicola Nara gc5]KAI8292342.1 hypothetical protein K4K60_007943 [Colletotrichum sp. SAR11_57]KAE9573533.1 hypothetical protein CGMCC3_g10321 [Colletotrichum fructicola]KAF4430412.1 hypothetical protein CFRS1_v014377 [Colletotrichum fructicola]KAF4902821.1 hypothetical protein CGCFRS4_v002056 [Colletotrichum fructicola]
MAGYENDKAPGGERQGKENNHKGSRREKGALDDGQDENPGDGENHVTAEEMTAQISNAINRFPFNGAPRTRHALFLLQTLNSNDSRGKYIKLYSQQRMLRGLVNDEVPSREKMMFGCDRYDNHLWYAAILFHVKDIDSGNQEPQNLTQEWKKSNHVMPLVLRLRDILSGSNSPHPTRFPKAAESGNKTDETGKLKATKRAREKDDQAKPPAKKARRSKAQARDMTEKDEEEDERTELEAARRESHMVANARPALPLPYAGPRNSVRNDIQPQTTGLIHPPRYVDPQVLQLNGSRPTNVSRQANNGPRSMQHDLGIYDNAQELSVHDPFFGFGPASSNQAGDTQQFDGSLHGFYQQPHAQHSNIAAASDTARLMRSGALYYGREIVASSQSGSEPVRYVGDLRPSHADNSASTPFPDPEQTTMDFTDGFSQQVGDTPSVPNPGNEEDSTVTFSYPPGTEKIFDDFFDYPKYRDDHAGH